MLDTMPLTATLAGRTALVITVSDRSHAGTQVDLSGPAVAAALTGAQAQVLDVIVVSDDFEPLVETLRQAAARAQLVVTTGGTGLAPRDTTPEATLRVCDRLVPGIPELIRQDGLRDTPFAALGRGICGVCGSALLLNLPGSPAGAESSLRAVLHLLPHALELLAGRTEHAAAADEDRIERTVKLPALSLLHKFSIALLAFLKPLGIWGVGGLALIDSALIPIPVSMDGIIIGYVASEPHKFLLYCLMAAAASAIGSLVPFYVGRAGGELFLLKRINRERYERIRDRFERQEFLAIMVPAMLPPPTPLKLFEFAAGVFEMKPVVFVLAIFCGKLVQFLVCSLLTIWYGPTLLHSLRHAAHQHMGAMIGVAIAALLALIFFVVRKIFDRRKGIALPMEE